MKQISSGDNVSTLQSADAQKGVPGALAMQIEQRDSIFMQAAFSDDNDEENIE